MMFSYQTMPFFERQIDQPFLSPPCAVKYQMHGKISKKIAMQIMSANAACELVPAWRW